MLNRLVHVEKILSSPNISQNELIKKKKKTFANMSKREKGWGLVFIYQEKYPLHPTAYMHIMHIGSCPLCTHFRMRCICSK